MDAVQSKPAETAMGDIRLSYATIAAKLKVRVLSSSREFNLQCRNLSFKLWRNVRIENPLIMEMMLFGQQEWLSRYHTLVNPKNTLWL